MNPQSTSESRRTFPGASSNGPPQDLWQSVTGRLVRLRSELAWVVLGHGLAFLGSFAGVKILTQLMAPEGYGQLALGMTLAGTVNLVLYGPLAQVVWRFYAVYRQRGELNLYWSLLRKAHLACAVGLLVVAAAAGGIVLALVNAEWAWLCAVALLFGIVSGFYGSLVSLQSALRHRKVVALHQAGETWLRITLAVVALHFFRDSGYFALLGYLLGTLLISLSQAAFTWKAPEVRDTWHGPEREASLVRFRARELAAYAAPFILWSGFAAASAYTDRWVLQGLFGSREVGIYFGLYQIANAPVSLLAAMIGQLTVPIIFERAGAQALPGQAEASRRLLHWTLSLFSLALLLVILASGLLSQPLVLLLTSPVYAERHGLLWVLVLGLAIFQVAQLLVTQGLCHNQPAIYLIPKVLHGVASFGFALVLGHRFGVRGVAWGLVLASLTYLLLVLRANKKV